MFRMFLMIGGALVANAAMADEATETLAPSSPWEINYDDDACHLASAFGEGDSQVIAVFSRYRPSDNFELRLYGTRFGGGSGAQIDVTTNFGSDDTDFRSSAFRGSHNDLPALIISSRFLVEWPPGTPPPTISPQQEASVRDLTIRMGSRQPFKLALGSMGPPMQAMRQCTEDLVRSWGFDPAEQARLSRPPTPRGNPGNWITTSDYPAEARNAGHLGLVRFRLTIEADGTVSACAIQAESTPADFSSVTCRAVTARARFLPALNEAGQPVRSYFATAVRWQLPG